MPAKPPKDKKKMTDAQGRAVPISYVTPFDRDRVARRILARFIKARDYLLKVKRRLASSNARFKR